MLVNKIKIRQGDIKNINSIIEFFKKELPEHWQENPKDFWIWINKSLSHKKSIISLAECGNKIVGYYCIVPKLLKIGKELVESGIGMHAIIDSDFNKDVSIMEVADLAYKIAKESGIKMLYGFPNNNYFLIQEKLERWDRVQIYNSIETKILNRFETPYKLKELFDYHNVFVKPSKNINTKIDGTISVYKDDDYYYQRYIKHPRSLYKSFLIMKDDKVVGFLVTKIVDLTKGHIIDFIIDDEVGYDDIIKLSNNYFFENGIVNLSSWPTSVKFKQTLDKIYHTSNGGFNTNFYIKFLDKKFEIKYKEKITNINNWSLPMGTSDAF